MKILITSLLLLLSFSLFSQKSNIFKIDSIPQKGILLDKGWKWHAGDNPDYAKPDFDDSGWEGIDPLSDITKVYNIIHKGEIGWLRLKFKVNQVPKSALALQFRQSGASEIYLNENMIYKFGVLDGKNAQNIKSYNPNETPLALTLSEDSIQTLAIRYAIQLKPLYATHFGNQNPVLKLTIKSINYAINDKIDFIVLNVKRAYIKLSVFGILSILFFSLFLFFKQNKVNLYFSIYTICLCITWSIFEFIGMPNYTDRIFWLSNIVLALQAIGYMFLLTAVYEVLHKNKSWSYYFLMAFSLICIYTGYQYYGWGWTIFGYIFLQLISLDIIRVSIISIKSKTKGAWIITIGGLIYFICWINFSFQFTKMFSNRGSLTDNLFDIAMLIMSVSFAIFLGYDNGYTNNLLKQKLVENEALSEEKQQILSTQNETLEKQVTERTAELVASQAQLIQSEKLASLGELTAGIAHEIQNPLNFVNNFSEVSNELLAELKGPLTPEGGILAGQKIDMDIISDLESNLEKISLHGKRASSIVKGMLEHSRTSTGEKELTDINALADEYLRLAYHGLRAKDSSFNADFKTELDPNLPKIMVIPQDIGRVLLNLINNAFQATPADTSDRPNGGAKLVVVKTLLVPEMYSPIGGRGAVISVSDNGSGMSPETKAKIFQPFFTTKPTGQGTGLGLSLAYDIITKGHGGTIECESEEGVGTEFVVRLPIV